MIGRFHRMVTVLCFVLCSACLSAENNVVFLDEKTGADTMTQGPQARFFAELQRREAAAMTSVPMAERSLSETQQLAVQIFRSAVLPFTEVEKKAVRRHVASLVRRFDERYPRLVQRSWKFIKTRKDLCGGFSFTCRDCIVLSENTLANLVKSATTVPEDLSKGERLLLHEQMHVIQREAPELFHSLYKNVFGFKSGQVVIHPWIEERQVTNPDGMENNWIAVVGAAPGEVKHYWVGTLLLTDEQVPVMGRDFVSVAVDLALQDDDGYAMVQDEQGRPSFQLVSRMPQLTSRFPIRIGYDHPNEIAAYLFTQVTHGPSVKQSSVQGASVFAQAKHWFHQNLRKHDNEDQRRTSRSDCENRGQR